MLASDLYSEIDSGASKGAPNNAERLLARHYFWGMPCGRPRQFFLTKLTCKHALVYCMPCGSKQNINQKTRGYVIPLALS